MAIEQNISQDLYDLLVSRGWEPESTDNQGQPAQPQDASIFTFDYVSSSGQNYGTAVAVLNEEGDLQLFYGDNLGRGMEEQDKNEWFGFLQQMKQFATRHDFHTFSPRNLNQLKHTMAGMAAIREGLFESYYGNKHVSYSGEPTEARLMIRHRKPLGETDARYRYVESLFIETQEGERWKLPFRMLAGGRAMLEHVRQGGRPYDIRGVHISELVEEINVLGRFRRATQGRMVEGVAQTLVEQAAQYLETARATLKGLSGSRGYETYFESWSPADIPSAEALVEQVKNLFVETTLDARIEAALPLLSRLQEKSMREADIFENWATRMAEGTWATPETPEAKKKLEDLMAQELPVGPDATNAIEQLYDIFGDDDLFDRLQDLAHHDPDADARFEIHSRAKEMGIDLPEPPMAKPDLARQPAPGQQDTEQVDEQDQDDVKAKCADLGQLKQDPMAMRDPDTRAEVLRRSHELGCDQQTNEGDNLTTFVGPNESEQRTDEIFADRQEENHGNGITADQLEVGDDVIITGPVQFEGATGIIDSFGRDKRFVVVNLYNHGKHSFHSSDVEGNDYADSDEEEHELNRYGERDAGLFGDDDRDDDMREDSTDPMDHRGAVTDSFYEDLARIKRLALSK